MNLLHKPSVFIVEGCDATGKSTLAKHLAERLHAAYFHSSAKGNLKVAQIDYLFNILDSVEQTVYGSNIPVVLDRHWPSEVCYAPVLRQPNAPVLIKSGAVMLNASFPAQEFFARFQHLQATYVFCLNDTALEKHRKHKDSDHPYTDSQYLAIYNNYICLLRSFLKDDVRVVLYDVNKWDKNVEGFIDKLLTYEKTKKI